MEVVEQTRFAREADSSAALRNDSQKSKYKGKWQMGGACGVAHFVWGFGLVAVGLFGGEGVALVELDLVPVGVGEGLGAGVVELGYLLGG